MSGGSYDYAYCKVEDFASKLSAKGQSPLRRAFAKHLLLVAEAMHDIEWVDSGDFSPGSDVEPIQKCLRESATSMEIEVLIADAKEVIEQLHNLIERPWRQ